jgi:hypothetical protein
MELRGYRGDTDIEIIAAGRLPSGVLHLSRFLDESVLGQIQDPVTLGRIVPSFL